MSLIPEHMMADRAMKPRRGPRSGGVHPENDDDQDPVHSVKIIFYTILSIFHMNMNEFGLL
jgi:hypothetical protein